jgi:thymidylate kinase
MRILITGLDGSGKTTQAQRLLAETSAGARFRYVWARWEPYLTRPLMAVGRRRVGGRARGERPSDDAGHADFVGRKQRLFRRRALRSLWTGVVLLEYLPQIWLRMLPALTARRHVLCDRALPDLWVDLAMNYGGDPTRLVELARHPLCRLFPRLDLVVLLAVPPEVGYERKRDGTPLAYLQAREPLYAALAAILPLRRVSAAGSPDAVQAELRQALAKELGLRPDEVRGAASVLD